VRFLPVRNTVSLPHSPIGNRVFSTLKARYLPPLPISNFSGISRYANPGRHEMFTGSYQGKNWWIKRISPLPDEIWLEKQETGITTSFETMLEKAEKRSLFFAENEVFKTSLLKLMVKEHTREEIFTVIDSVPIAAGDTGKPDTIYPVYYVAASDIENFESLGEFHNVNSLFTVNANGFTVFNHPEKGPQLVKGRILIKCALYLLGEKDTNLRNLALGGFDSDGRRRFITYDHELCGLTLEDRNTALKRLVGDQHIISIFPDLNLSSLDIARRHHVKEEAIRHFNSIYNSDAGQHSIKALLIQCFSPRHKEILMHEIYTPLLHIATVVKEANHILCRHKTWEERLYHSTVTDFAKFRG
jgi:hypothetical protein